MKLPAMLKSITLMALLVMTGARSTASSFAERPIAQWFSNTSAQLPALSLFPVFGDFDGDRRLDQAEPHSSGAHHYIYVQFGNSSGRLLEFGNRPHSSGALLAWDINLDNKLDLIWVSRTVTERPVVWLGDGRGHFEKAAEWKDDSQLRGRFGDTERAVAGDVSDERLYLAPDPIKSEVARSPSLETEVLSPVMIAGRNRRRDLGLYLSYPRERGPPLHNHSVLTLT
jgi:hypothetical protein